jgi:hypothetical protein
MRLACSRGGLIDTPAGLGLRELEPDPVGDLGCGRARVQAGEDVVEAWDAGDYDGCEHHCLADCFPMTISPTYLSDQYNEALEGVGRGMGCLGQETSVE